ncbi:DUF2946 family protein [Sphingobium cloacae]|uniref:DUF2946 domain-containing protein n=1 Tax=Sphingobium cloacae TaxID=120107 RepID=A0A1E1F6M0_9SPHN|nr:DUF2946 family protein [Sphingobium cloacae]BAV66155.1 hypothetical protein SCLO_1031150 [Sphingobium cloacae]
MMGAIRQSDNARGLLAALGLLVLAIQLLAPSGFMPVRTEKGVMVTLCSGTGPVKVMVDRDAVAQGRMKQKHQPADDGAMQQHCAFAGANATPTVPPLPLADLLLPTWQRAFGPIAFALRTGFIARLAAPPPPSSGPPAAF